jgi:hypothetical protein
MQTTAFMPKPTGKVVGTFLTDPADLLFVETEAETEGRTVSNWLRREIKKLRKRREEEKRKPGKNKDLGEN